MVKLKKPHKYLRGLLFLQCPSRARTEDPLSKRAKGSSLKSQETKQITPSDTAGRSDQQSEGGIPDADLAALVAAWPKLPDSIRAAIRASVSTVE
jgi:hypothetical protein